MECCAYAHPSLVSMCISLNPSILRAIPSGGNLMLMGSEAMSSPRRITVPLSCPLRVHLLA